ncbi:MAG: hypothetical protein KatS3mg050_4475 [Litorilinea sp.]|nr:MAG: hypothetical protein KatS3mg050_4475 [Litorilinea sp.]
MNTPSRNSSSNDLLSNNRSPNNPSPQDRPYRLTHDPVFYITAAFFALLTTALPAGLGQPRFLPLIQAVGLTVFLAIPLRRGEIRQSLYVVALWLAVQFVTITALSWLVIGQVERAIPDGFLYRGAMTRWFFDQGPLPSGLAAAPVGRLAETAGVLVGAPATGGLVANWFVVRAINLAGYGMASLLLVLASPAALLAALPLWTLVRVAGYAGLTVLLAEPPLTGNWSPRHIWHDRRTLLLWSVGLVAVGTLLELFLPALWSALFR